MTKDKVRAVFFDADDTLYPFMGWKKPALEQSARKMKAMGHPWTYESLVSKIIEISKAQGNESRTWIDAVYEQTLERLPSVYEREGIITEYRKFRDAHLQPFPGVEKVLLELREMKLVLGIITDAEEDKQCQRLHTAGIAHYFNPELIIAKEEQRKPNPEPFTRAYGKLCKINKMPCQQLLMVGDSYERDIQGAKALGWQTALVLVAKPPEERQNSDVFTVRDDISELLDYPDLPKLDV